MSEKPLPFVVTDRRKFTTDGELRPDAEIEHKDEEREERRRAEQAEPEERPGREDEARAEMTAPEPESAGLDEAGEASESEMPPPPSAEQMEQSRIAFEATAERLDVAIRAANPGADHPPALTFESLVQSVYMQAIVQLGGATPEGQKPQVDILGAKQSIDMLGILTEKTKGNLTAAEGNLLASALFELRLAFLEITQALARSAQQRAGGPGAPQAPAARPGPSIVR